ncbi:hypothetical protein PHYC_02042 [Phycisphaerales bacterium]|nr:hypothetical protein PHYC_02042 [Phycisphaerales bacterium]
MARDDLPDIPPTIKWLAEAREHGLLESDLGRVIARSIALGLDDPFAETWLRRRVLRHRVRQALAGPFDLPRDQSGNLILGLDLRGRPVRVPVAWLNAHCCTIGGSGSGKTTKSLFMALGVAPHARGLWLFDLRKSEFRRLVPLMQRWGIALLRVHARQLRLNPLQVPLWVEPRAWASAVADMLVHAMSLQSRSSKLLHALILDLYEEFQVEGVRTDTRPTTQFPTLFDLRQAAAGCSEAHPQAKAAIVDALDPVLLSLGPAVLGYRYGWTTHDLARRHVVFEFAGVSRADQDLLLNTLLLSEFMSRIAGGLSNAPMDLYISIDEAARLVSAANPSAVVSDMLGLVRGAGIGIDLSVQSAHDVHPAVFSNTAFKCIGRCGSATDYDALGAAMGLTPPQRQWAMQHLVPGTFVVQLGEGTNRRPFVLRVPPFPNEPEAGRPTEDGLGDLPRLPTRPAGTE